MNPQLICVSGEKGGVGKSLTASVLVDHALANGENPFVVEGDQGVPDVAARYRGHVRGLQVALQRPDTAGEAVTELFMALEQVFAETGRVIINLPGGASGTVDTVARELIAPTLEGLGVQLTTVYVLGPGEESVQSLEASLQWGLCAISDHCIAAPNRFFGNPDRFAWNRSPLRGKWLESGFEEHLLPALIPRIADHIRNLPGPYHRLASGEVGDLTMVERAGLNSWLRACEPLAQAAWLGPDLIEAAA